MSTSVHSAVLSDRDRFLEAFAPLNKKWAMRSVRNLPKSFDPADMQQIGVIKLIEIWPAMKSFARKHAEGAMKNCARGAAYREATHEAIEKAEEHQDRGRSVLDRIIDKESIDGLQKTLHQLPADQARAIYDRFRDAPRGRPRKRDTVAEGRAMVTLARAA
jgi:DNA-directed RNA polymerase specialized sigma subunit